tara:strand:- start:123 stop:257 length:135 start_codon:yes stop_codon:yes gene_type:complete
MSRSIFFKAFVRRVLPAAVWPDPSGFNRQTPTPLGMGAWDEKGK